LYPLGVEKSEAYAKVDLKVRFPKSYPNKPPELHLVNPKGLSPNVLRQLTHSLQQTAKQLQGQEMMYDLSDHVRAFLANHNAPPSAISKLTLHEQMVIRNEQDLKVEREREMEELDRKRKEREAELRVQSDMMNEKIQQDLERKREHARVIRQQQRQELGFAADDDAGEAIVDDDFHTHFVDGDSILNNVDGSDIKLVHFENLVTVSIEKEENGIIPKVGFVL
jgi:translation initiation factor 2-alpha kinase 4